MTINHPDFSSEPTARHTAITEKDRRDSVLSKEDIKRIRKHYGESQAQFAKRLEVDAVTVARWETGQRKCTGSFANLVALLDPHGNTVVRNFLTESSSLRDLTNRALKAILLAQSEAHRFGSTWVGTEHLLLGLIGEGKGAAAHCCQLNNISFAHAAIGVEMLNGWGVNTIVLERPLSNRIQSMLELPSAQARFHALNFGIPYSPKFEELLARGAKLAETREDNCVGTAHLLTALLDMDECAAIEVLTSMGVDRQRIKQHLDVLMLKADNRLDVLPQVDQGKSSASSAPTASISGSLSAAADCLHEASRRAFLWQDYNLAFWIRDCENNLRKKLLENVELSAKN